MDCYKPAINNCMENAKRNKVEDRVEFYHTDKVANINNSEKFDLVVGNPPHSFDYVQWAQSQLTLERPTQQDFPYWDNTVRIDVDKDMLIHKEFFDNIRDKLTDDADIFISEVGDKNPVIKYAKSLGYELVAVWNMRSMNNNTGDILHLRPKFSGFVL